MRPDTGIEYTVTWAIEVYADTPEDAAQQAEDIMRDPTSLATVFDVQPFGKPEDSTRVDLEELNV